MSRLHPSERGSGRRSRGRSRERRARPARGGDDVLDDRETEPGPGGRTRGVAPVEALEASRHTFIQTRYGVGYKLEAILKS
jgi:hypothetical protein